MHSLCKPLLSLGGKHGQDAPGTHQTRSNRSLVWLCLLLVSVLGCRLPGSEGPVPESLATCRQLSQQGVAAMERGRWQEAETLLAGAVEACPVECDTRRNYAETLWRRGARSKAIGQLEVAAKLAADDASLHVRLAEMYLEIGRTQLARGQAEQALDLDPKLAAGWLIRGRINHKGGDVRQALADYHRALGYAANDRGLLMEIGELYRELNQPQRALSVLQSLADTYSPGEEPRQVLYLQGEAHSAMGRYDDAAQSFSLAAGRGVPTPEILHALAEAECSSGRPDAAAAAARQALTLDPQHQPSHRLLGRLELARQPGRIAPR